MLPVMRIHVVGQKTLDGANELTVEPVDENGFEYGSFKQNVVFPGRCRSYCRRSRVCFLLSEFLSGSFRSLNRRSRRRWLQQLGKLRHSGVSSWRRSLWSF